MFDGNYENGKFEGKGTYTWADGTKYEGEFKDGLKEGFGKWCHYKVKGGETSFLGMYKSDMKHG